MAIKLIGDDTTTPDAFLTPGYVVFIRYQAVASGTCSKIKVQSSGNGNVKVAAYADSAGEPGSRLAKQDTPTAVVAGLNTISLEASFPVTSGTYYWIAAISDAQILGYLEAGTNPQRHKAATFSTYTFPDPAGTGYGTGTNLFIWSGWETGLSISPSSIVQSVIYGSPKLNLSIKPSSTVQQVAYGTPIVATVALIIYPTSVVQPISIGTPILKYRQTISPSSIIVTIAYGTPSVGIFGIIKPQSIVQQISLGSPTILKYVWHVILDGQYATETPGVNRAYVIGRDQYGNPAYGTAVNTDEVALVGERLDFQQELAIPLTAQAAEVAAAILSKIRITGKKGLILIPPNCGQELFDVVQITDSGANQAAVSFRVVGLRFEYNPRQAKYEHKLILGAP